jgi:hypothetical protein
MLHVHFKERADTAEPGHSAGHNPKTKQRFDPYLRGWREWMWTLPYEPHPDCAEFKGIVYAAIDPRMQRFFPVGVKSRIRLDEIDWGGVTVNGIPPLYYPKTLPAAAAWSCACAPRPAVTCSRLRSPRSS